MSPVLVHCFGLEAIGIKQCEKAMDLALLSVIALYNCFLALLYIGFPSEKINYRVPTGPLLLVPKQCNSRSNANHCIAFEAKR